MNKNFICLFLIVFMQNTDAALHPKMGAPHILDPEGLGLFAQKSDFYFEEPFSASPEYKEVLETHKKAQKALEETEDPSKKARLQKIVNATNKVLIQLSLKDRQNHLIKNRSHAERSRKENWFHPLNASIGAESSGALLWAHRQGVLGQGVEVIVIERVGYSPSPTLSKLIKNTDQTERPERFIPSIHGSEEHASAVTNILYQVAPRSGIKLVQDREVDLAFHPDLMSDKALASQRIENLFPEEPLILNWSGGKFNDFNIGGIEGFFKGRSKKFGDLLVKAVPNSGGLFGGGEIDHLFNKRVFNNHSDQIILVGNLDQYGGVPVKPLNKLQESRFLCAYGNEVLTINKMDEVKPQSTTSMAAPIISGAVALIKSKYPHLTPQEVGDILLESAERNFWTSSYRPTLVYDPEDFPESPAKILRLPADIELKPFDSKIYGRGVLNLRRAFLYAELKVHHPKMTMEELRPLFKAAVHEQERIAAHKIQSAFRKYREKRRKLNIV